MLKLEGVKRHFPLYSGTLLRRRTGTVRAVDGIDLEILQGETLGLVGESGCGKSTTVLEILNLVPPDAGSISVFGTDVRELRGRAARRALRRDLQVVFQDPMGSLDPRMSVHRLVAEPLAAFGERAAGTRGARRRAACASWGWSPVSRNATRSSSPADSASAWGSRARWP